MMFTSTKPKKAPREKVSTSAAHTSPMAITIAAWRPAFGASQMKSSTRRPFA